MADEKQKCPMCSTKLKMINGRMTCKACGYYIRNPYEEQTGLPNEIQYQAQTQEAYRSVEPYQTQAREGQAYQDTSAYYIPTEPSTASPAPQKKQPSLLMKCIIAYICLQLGLCVAVVVFQGVAFVADYNKEENAGTRKEAKESKTEKVQPSQKSALVRRLPKSEFFQQVAEAIWEKDYTDITEEEYASLTDLQISQDERAVYYRINNGDTYTITNTSSIGYDLSDLSVFSGLEWLSIDARLHEGDLDGLDSLWGVYMENPLEECLSIIPYPENILELGIGEAYFMKSLEGIETFSNLEYFTLEECDWLEDISDLGKIPDLRGLYLTDCDELSDYSVLMQLGALEELSITSDNLRSIDFVGNMPLLQSLYIEDSQIISLDALRNCTQLLSLQLIDNLNVEDYSAVGELEQLFELTLEMQYDGTLPSFEKLKQLQMLSIKYAGDLTPLKDAASVTALRLERCSGWELDALTSMQELTTLSICEFSSAADSLEPLTRLPKLESLDLSGTSIFGNIEEIFGIPTLRYLYLDDCQAGMDFDNIPSNETLETLYLNDISILYDPTYNNGNKVKLSEHYDMFGHFPNLTDLSVASTEIDSIEFVDMLPKLQYLDITDNYVTSLKPLENLKDFQIVWCKDNAIMENVSNTSNIIVVMSNY